MPDWDADSPELRQSLTRILEEIVEQAARRETPTVEIARRWQRLFMQGLKAEPRYVGAFRGEPGLERKGAKIGRFRGSPAATVADELQQFEKIIRSAVAELDRNITVGRKLTPRTTRCRRSLLPFAFVIFLPARVTGHRTHGCTSP